MRKNRLGIAAVFLALILPVNLMACSVQTEPPTAQSYIYQEIPESDPPEGVVLAALAMPLASIPVLNPIHNPVIGLKDIEDVEIADDADDAEEAEDAEIVEDVLSNGGSSETESVSVAVDLSDPVAFANEIFRLTNVERTNAGLPLLTEASELTQIAMIRANEIIGSFSHTRPDGRSCFTVFSDNNVRYRCAGENIAYGQRTPADVVQAWMNSAGHRANILKEEYNHMGIYVTVNSNGRHYFAQNFTD